MSDIEKDLPAFPRPFSADDVDPDISYPAHAGMTLRQYAAITLKVPNSGTDWLDDMIFESLRSEIAIKALQGVAGEQDLGVDEKVLLARRMTDAIMQRL